MPWPGRDRVVNCTEEDMPMHRSHIQNRRGTRLGTRVAPALLWFACASCAWAQAGAAGPDALEDEVLAAGRASAPSPVTSAPAVPAVDRIVDLRLPAAAPDDTGARPASPITYTGLDTLLGDDDGTTGTFDYTALPRELDDDARWEPASERKERGIDATVSVAAGTGGMMQTSASVTVPMLDDRLTIRISGATGSGNGYMRDFSRGGDGLLGRGTGGDGMGAFGTGAWDGSGPWDGRRRGNDDFSRLGVDLRWTPEARNRDVRP